MEYHVWTTKDLEDLIMGNNVSSVCKGYRHGRCVNVLKGCSSILMKGYMNFEGNTDEDRIAARQRIASEQLAKCREVSVIIKEV